MRFLFILSCVTGQLAAQAVDSAAQKAPKARYFFSFRSGMLFCHSCTIYNAVSVSATTVHGVRIGNRFAVAAGLAYNNYGTINVMPYFANLSTDLAGRRSKLFAEFSYGSAKAWLGEYARGEYGYKGVTGRQMLQPSIGYRVSYYNMSVYVLVGYQFQRTVTNYEYPNFRWLNGQQIELRPSRRQVTADFSRMLVSLGVGLK